MDFETNRILPIFLVVILIALQYRLWFQSDGILDMIRMKKELNRHTTQTEHLKNRNQALLEQIKTLQNNEDMMESSARQELGMIKQDETFYQVVNP